MKHKIKVGVLFVVLMVLAFAVLSALPKLETREIKPAMPVIEPMFMWIKHFQMALADAGYDPGPIDCIYGPQTIAAWKRYEADYMAQEIK